MIAKNCVTQDILAGATLGALQVSDSLNTMLLKNPHREYDWADAVLRASEFRSAIEPILGVDLKVESSLVIVKKPFSEFCVPVHQDGVNDRLRLIPERALSIWIAITESSAETGGLRVYPKSHQQGYLPFVRMEESSPGYGKPLQATDVPSRFSPISLQIYPGDACLFSVCLLHDSLQNRSSKARVGMNIRVVAPAGIEYRAAECGEMFDLCRTFAQKELSTAK